MAATIRIIVSTQGGVDKVKSDVEGLGKGAEGAAKGFGTLRDIGVGAMRQLGAIAVNAGLAAASAFADFVKGSVAVAGDFESGMNSFSAVVGSSLDDSGQSLDDFKELFISLGRELPVSTAEVQQAAIELAKGGIDPATIAAGGLRTALDLAAAGGVGLAESATIMAKQLGVWIDSSADAATKSQFLAESADLIAQAANASVVDVHDLALGLANAGGMAKVAGLTFRETVTTMAMVSAGFSSAGDAGTSFKTFLGRLQPTTDAASTAMKQLNLLTAEGKSKFYDATGSFIGMENAAGLLQQSLGGLSQAQKTSALQAIFGADAFRMAAILADKGAQGYKDMAESMAKAGGVAQQAAARQMGFNTALDNIKGSLEALQITLGSAALPALTRFINVVASGVNALTDYVAATQKGETVLAVVASVLRDAMMPALIGVTAATIAYAIANGPQLSIALIGLVEKLAATAAGMWSTALATAAAAAPFIVLGAAVAGVALIWNKLNTAVKDASTQLLETRAWWTEAGDAVLRFGQQTGEAKTQLTPFAATITAIREQIQGELEDLGKRMTAGMVSQAQYESEMATINRHREGLIQATAAYNAQETAIINTQAASMTATNAAATLTTGTLELGNQASLTAKDIEELGKKIQDTFQKGQEAVNAYAMNFSTFASSVEVRQLEHTAKITELEAQKAAATTAEQRKGIDAQIAAANESYRQQEQSAAESYARQQAEQNAHLGQMLIDYTVSQAQLGNIAKEKAAEITAALEVEYGLQESSNASTFLRMAQAIDSSAKSSGGSIDGLIGNLRDEQSQAAETKKAMDDYAVVYTAEQVNNFLDGKSDARAYISELEKIPRTVTTQVRIERYETGGTSTGDASGGTGKRASGGPITAGLPYLVGEKGPEMVIPNQNGMVIPAAATRTMLSGGNTTNNYSLTFAPSYSGTPRERMDLNFAKSLAGVA